VAVTAPVATEAPVVSLISLGCAKNEVDSERILGLLASEGFLVTGDPAAADICLVNTCGFLHEAREESAGVLRELQALKQAGQLKAVIALGCLVERAHGADETASFLDAADASIGFADYPRLAELCRKALQAPPTETSVPDPGVSVTIGDKRFKGLASAPAPFTESYREFLLAPRMRIGSPHIAHLKISEGCSNFCKFCSIPYIRGVHVSRTIEDIAAEACRLVEGGAKELSLIAQDTSSYGRDLYGEPALTGLLQALGAAVPEDIWIRVMYAFPRFLTDDMLRAMAADPRICPYIDMPLQHISDPMLSAMGRGMGKADTIALLDRIRDILDGGAIRTTFIVGHPGETEAAFEELLAFVREGRFSHVGVFLYSREPKTPSAKLPDTLPLEEKKRRRDALMQAQLEVSRRRLKDRVGTTVPVMLDGPVPPGSSAPAHAAAIGRTRLEAVDVDGVVFLKGRAASRLAPGTVRKARITRALDYDLVAELA
jgi:ribosomal protein S12 methylthiotransferase